MDESRIIEKVAKLEAITDDHKEEINRLKDDNSLLHRVASTQEHLVRLIDESEKTHKETRQTLKEINENMNRISVSQEKLQLSQDTMQGEITQMKGEINSTNSKFVEIEKKVEESTNRGKFDVVEFLSKDVVKLIGLAIIVAILALIGLKP